MRPAQLTPFLFATLLSVSFPAPARAQQPGGTLVQVMATEPESIAPHLSVAPAVAEIGAKIYDGLLDYGPDLQPQPALAQAVEVASDGRTLTFRLRDGVTFHDGKPFTSADVRYSIMEVLRKRHPRGQSIYKPVTAVETPDPRTAVLRLSEPAPWLLACLAAHESPMLPRHLDETGASAGDALAARPVGTGPFRLTHWQRGQSLRLERHAGYWQQGLPLLDAIVVRFVKDEVGRSALLESGGAQLASPAALAPLAAHRLAESMRHLEVSRAGAGPLTPMVELVFNVTRTPFDKPAIRQAVSLALDRQGIIQAVWAGYGRPATGPIATRLAASGLAPPSSPVPSGPEAIERANRLLDQAGLRRKEDGQRLAIVHDVAPYGPEWQQLGEQVEIALARLGIKASLRYETVPAWRERLYGSGEFQLASNVGYSLCDPALGVHRTLHSRMIGRGLPYANAARWSEARADAALDRAMVELDPLRRAQAYRELAGIVAAAAPIAWIAELEPPVVHDRRLRDAVRAPLGVYGSFAEAWLEPKPAERRSD
jgi:peptide/nickel transport system substrate-binding protein